MPLPIVDFYPAEAGTSEPSLRQEMINTLEGRYPEIAKGQTVLLRRFRRDSSGGLILCACVDQVTGEPDKDEFCPISHAERHLWDEEEIIAFPDLSDLRAIERPARTLSAGLLNVPLGIFYMRYDVSISPEDKLVEIELDVEGIPVLPYRRTAIWRINDLLDMRSDNGRREFWKVYGVRDFVKFLNPPTG